jgi:hypothetical protein
MPTYIRLFATLLLTILMSSAFTSKFRRQDQTEISLQPSIIRVLPISAALGCWLWALMTGDFYNNEFVHPGGELAIPFAALALSLPAILVASLTALFLKTIYASWSRSIVCAAAICGEALLLGPYPDSVDSTTLDGSRS